MTMLLLSIVLAAVPSHLLTAIYGNGGSVLPTPNPSIAPVSVQAKFVTWAYSGGSGGTDWVTAYESVGVKTLIYLPMWRNYTGQFGYADLAPGGANAAAEAKDCTGTPVTDGHTYIVDPRNAGPYGLRHLDYVAHSVRSVFTAFFLDNVGVVAGLGSLPCGYLWNANFIPATNSLNSQITNSAGRVALLFLNVISGYWIDNDGPNGFIDSTKMSDPPNVLGLECETCYLRHNVAGTSNGKIGGSNWADIEDAEIALVQKHKIFWSYANSTCAPADSTLALDQRMYELASFLLTYDPAYAMMQECFTSTPSNFEVMPETQFVPELPTGTAAASVYTYQIAGTNLFARQFQACYYKAALVGSCAIIVNPTSGTYVIPSAMYNAYLTRISLAGAGVLDGGTLSFSATKTSTIGPYGSEILIHK